MMDIDSMIAVLEAAKVGKRIQARGLNNQWIDCHASHQFNFCDYDYRVKPEPREWDIAVYKFNNRPYPLDWIDHDSKNSWEQVRVREVIE